MKDVIKMSKNEKNEAFLHSNSDYVHNSKTTKHHTLPTHYYVWFRVSYSEIVAPGIEHVLSRRVVTHFNLNFVFFLTNILNSWYNPFFLCVRACFFLPLSFIYTFKKPKKTSKPVKKFQKTKTSFTLCVKQTWF